MATSMIERRIVKALKRRFRGRTDRFLADKRIAKAELDDEAFLRHLQGVERIGVLPGETATFLCLDFDGKNLSGGKEEAWRQVRDVIQAASAYGLALLPELSRSGQGYHLWLLFDEKDAPDVLDLKQLGKSLLTAAELPDDEAESRGHPGIYPHPPGAKGAGKTAYLPLHGLLGEISSGNLLDGSGAPLDDPIWELENWPVVKWSEVPRSLPVAKDLEIVEHDPPDQRKAPKIIEDRTPAIAAEVSRHDTVRDFAMFLANRYPKDEAQERVLALAKSLNLLPKRDAEIRELVDSAYRKPGVVHSDSSWAPMDLNQIWDATNSDMRYVVPGLIGEGEFCLMAAMPGTGKTMVMVALAVALASGTDVLGQFEASAPRRVLYVDEECGKWEMGRRIRKIAEGIGADSLLLKQNLRVYPQVGMQLNSAESIALFHRDVRAFKPDLVIIDTLLSVLGAEENSNSEARSWYQKVLAPLRSDPGCAVLLTHHVRKAAEDGQPRLYDIRGASDFYGAPEKVFGLTKEKSNDPSRILKLKVSTIKARRNDPTGEVLVVFEDNTEGTTTSVQPHAFDKELSQELGGREAAKRMTLWLLRGQGRVAKVEIQAQVTTTLGVSSRTLDYAIEDLRASRQIRQEKDEKDARKTVLVGTDGDVALCA